MAQTGPAGVGSSANNVLWLSADHGAFSNAGTTPATNGQNVRQWNDRSGNGRHAAQSTSANRPNWHSDQLNGYPVMRYTAANNDRMQSTGLNSANVASVFVVARYTSLPSPNPGLVQGTPTGLAYTADAAQKTIGMWVASSNTRLWGRGVQSNGTQRQIAQVTALAANTTYLMNSVYDGSVIQQYVNNAVSGSESYNGTLRSWTDMAIGAQHGTEGWNGDIAEVIVYNTSVNSAQRIIIANYLAAKYGFSLAANDVYREDDAGRGNYDHDVAGIGRINASNQHIDGQGPGILRISNPTDLNNNEFLLWGHDNGMLGAWGVGDLADGVQGRLERVWRISERNTAGTAAVDVGAVDLTFDLSSLGNVDPSHLRLIVDTDNDGVFADELALSGAIHLGGSLYRFAGVGLLSDGVRLTLGTSNMTITPLPIDLVYFRAMEQRAGVVDLEWATASEWDNERFVVERSADMESWQVVAEKDAVGHSNALVEYATIDDQPISGTNYYRLRQVDLDGTSTLSNVVVVELGRSGTMEMAVFPNPAQSEVFVRVSGSDEGAYALSVVDDTGRPVHQRMVQLTGNQQFHLDLHHLVPGSYTLRLHAGEQAKAVRLLLVR